MLMIIHIIQLHAFIVQHACTPPIYIDLHYSCKQLRVNTSISVLVVNTVRSVIVCVSPCTSCLTVTIEVQVRASIYIIGF